MTADCTRGRSYPQIAQIDADSDEPEAQARVPCTLDAQDDDHGGSYLLYTVGADGEDNGGKIAPRSMMNAFTHNGQGFDFVFTNPQWE